MSSIKKLNDSTEPEAIALIVPLIERAPHIAKIVAGKRPFSDVNELSSVIKIELQKLDQENLIQLFRAHPELAPDNPLSMTGESQQEQKRLNLTSAMLDNRTHFDLLNAQYREKFGFPFITALINHQNTESVLAEFKTRISGDIQSEIKNALNQISTVSSSRALEAFGEINQELQVDDDPRGDTNWVNSIGGGFLAVLSLFFILGGWDLGLGIPTRLGTGAFPFITGLIVFFLSVFICVLDKNNINSAETPDWVAFLTIIASIAIFALMAESFGLVPAIFLSVIVASLPDKNLSMANKALLGGIVALGCWILFIVILDLPFKAIVGV